MRVLLDTNIFISYLLTPNSQSAVVQIINAAFMGEFTLLVPEELLDELARKVPQKKYLADRITQEEVRELADLVSEIGEAIPSITDPIPAITRDPKDDYLIAYAVVGQADYLVTRDDDLLVLGEVEGVRVVSPGGFLEGLVGRG